MPPWTGRNDTRPWWPGVAASATLAWACTLALLVPALAAQDVEPPASAPVDTSLDGRWELFVDPQDVGLANGWLTDLSAGRKPASAPSDRMRVPVPLPIEAVPGMFFYDGVVWYVRRFTAPQGSSGARSALRFDQVNYACRAWIDGIEVGRHEGGYEPFEFELSGLLADDAEHVLVLRVVDVGPGEVDGLRLETTPHAKESWYENFGGILGSVTLRVHDAPRAEVRYIVSEADTGNVRVGLGVRAPPDAAWDVQVDVVIDALPLFGDGPVPDRPALPPPTAWRAADAVPVARSSETVAITGGWADAPVDLLVTEPRLWSPAAPYLYRVRVLVDGEPTASRSFGFRTVQLVPDGLYVNGERIVLKGVLWQPHFWGTGGVTPPPEALEDEVRAILATGFNLVRAHVRPAPPAFLDAADRLGLMVLEEPAIGWVSDDDALLDRLEREVRWMIVRDHHHPSIVLWGLLNELSGKAYRYGTELAHGMSRLDHSRPVLEDSGSFFGSGRYVPAGAKQVLPMLDEHIYPPAPLPLWARDRLAGIRAWSGPTFVSEFGYGTVVEAGTAAEELADRPGAERKYFESSARVITEARTTGASWSQVGWKDETARVQAEALEEMVEALRSNPALDMLCLTQWQAVSHESSAGLITPWGADRPARAAVGRALRPLLLATLPQRKSVTAGEALDVVVAVVNDTGVPVEGALQVGVGGPDDPLAWSAVEPTWLLPDLGRAARELGAIPLPPELPSAWSPGVTRVHLAVPATGTGPRRIAARILDGATVLDTGVARQVEIVPPAPPERLVQPEPGVELPVSVVTFGPAPATRVERFARREGLRLVAGLDAADPRSTVALVTDGGELARTVPFQERLDLWQFVWTGGVAVVLLDEPSAGGDFVQLAGGARGVALPHGVPLPLQVSAAAGNFRGRFHVSAHDQTGAAVFVDEAAGQQPPGARLLGAADSEQAPVAMVVDEPPAGARTAMLTLSHLEQRLGCSLLRVPFGRGVVTIAGLPLLAAGDEPARERRLADLVLDTLAVGIDRRREQGADPSFGRRLPRLPVLSAEALAYASAVISRLAAMAERHSALVAGGMGMAGLPEFVSEMLALERRAVLALIEGRTAEGEELLREALGRIEGAGLSPFFALESDILAAIGELLRSEDARDLDLAYRVLESWASGVVFWFAGDEEAGLSWLGTARLQLVEAGWMAADEES